METSFLWLCEVSSAMFLGSMMAGLIPLKLSISEKKMRLCQIFGAGLLIGTAFTVIIPEGIEALYSARPHVETVRTERAVNSTREKRHAHQHAHDVCELYHTPHIAAKLGFSLVSGFMLMLLIDQLSATPRSGRALRRQMGTSATIGLAVHAAVDGVAMGTSSFSDQQSLKWIIFMAIMLHKMPAAFGLVSFLQSTRISARRILRHLTVFSLSAPSAAVVTFWLMNWITWLSSQVAIGCLMLFSAGTFMYVATIHVFPELSRSSHDPSEDDVVSSELEAMIVGMQKPLSADSHHPHHHGHSHPVGPSLSCHDLFFMMFGSLLPGISMFIIH